MERRKYARTIPREPLRAEIGIWHEGRIVDVSLGGACLEHKAALRPGEPCILRFGFEDRVFAFRSQVVWSQSLQVGRRRSDLMFHSGLAFEKVPVDARPLLADFTGESAPDDQAI